MISFVQIIQIEQQNWLLFNLTKDENIITIKLSDIDLRIVNIFK